MPSTPTNVIQRVWTGPETCMGGTGRTIDWPIVFYLLEDMLEHGNLSRDEYNVIRMWMESYKIGGALPGCARFRSPYTGKMQWFPAWVDDLIDIWQTATNWIDLTDEESEADSICGDENIDLYKEWPKNVIALCRHRKTPFLQW